MGELKPFARGTAMQGLPVLRFSVLNHESTALDNRVSDTPFVIGVPTLVARLLCVYVREIEPVDTDGRLRLAGSQSDSARSKLGYRQ